MLDQCFTREKSSGAQELLEFIFQTAPTAAREDLSERHQQREQEAKKRTAVPPQELTFTKAKIKGRSVNILNDRMKNLQSHQSTQIE